MNPFSYDLQRHHNQNPGTPASAGRGQTKKMKMFRHWARGLAGAAITGCSTSLLSVLGISGANAVGIHIEQLQPRQLLATTLFGGIVGAAAFLKQSPIPPEDDLTPKA